MAEVGIALGSNLGDREKALNNAVHLLERAGLIIVKASAVIETDPVGYFSEKPYLNQCLIAKTALGAVELLELLLAIENKAGRKRVYGQMSDRPLDLDLLFFDELIVSTEKLTLPHPRLHERLFVLKPLLQIKPEWRHPLSGLSVCEMIERTGLVSES